ncbi:MAG: protein-glutamate O-methyltransferase CheR [Candidatus Riflebacteria bacterium]|nr:protein-glutamate O-methyltransferase CheR [Candidatus Riflebacteria bacterium]
MAISKQDFEKLKELVRDICGINITDDKFMVIERKLESFLSIISSQNFNEFLEKLALPSGFLLREKLIDVITTNETLFFRDVHPFETFSTIVIPRIEDLLKSRTDLSEGKFRIWSAGSSTGQEPYSIAMLLNEYSEKKKTLSPDKIEILASDISSSVLSRAISGQFNSSQIKRGLKPYFLDKYFQKSGNKWVIDEKIRNMVEFRRINLIDNFSILGKFDVVLCRNVLIYFDTQMRKNVLEKINRVLFDGGFLFVGASEIIMDFESQFSSERNGSTIFYRKKLSETDSHPAIQSL